MEIQFDDIAGSERRLRQVSQEEFVDDTCPRHANGTLLLCGRTCDDDHTAHHALLSHWDLWAIVEAACRLAFRTLLKLIRGKVQTRLDQRVIEDAVLFVTSHKSKASQVHQHSSRPILAIEPEQRVRRFELICGEIATNGREPLVQFFPIPSVPSVPKRAEPLEAVRLTDRGAGTNYLPALASSVSRSAQLIQPAKGWGQLIGLR